MQSEQTGSAGTQQAARAGCIDRLFGETMTEAGVGAVMSVTTAAILWAPDTRAMLLGWLGCMAVFYGLPLGLRWGYQRSPSRNARATAWSVLFTLGVTGTFLTWGLLGIAMYGRATPYQQGFVLLLTACMILATLAIYRGAALAVHRRARGIAPPGGIFPDAARRISRRRRRCSGYPHRRGDRRRASPRQDIERVFPPAR